MRQSNKTIQSYSLFGESQHLPDVLHCETIADRSVLHDWELAPHRHARLHQLLYIQSGGGEVDLEGETLALTPGAMVNIPAGHVHAFRFLRHTEGWVTTMADELLDELLTHVGDVRRDLSHAGVIHASPSMAHAMGQIWHEFSGQSQARALVLRGLSAALLGWVSRSLTHTSTKHPAPTDPHLLQRFTDLIEAHFLEHWRVSDYAKALSISPTHLSRLARQTSGRSASRMIDARLMREARRNLAYTHLSISSIAYSLGYADPAYFTRAFKRDSGRSPKAFRTQIET